MEQKEPINNTLTAACTFVIAAIAVAAALAYTRAIMIPFVVALFLSYFIAPIVLFFKSKLRFPHWLAVISAFLGVALFVTIFVLVLRNSIIEIIDSFYLYEERIQRLSENLINYANHFGLPINKHSVMLRLKDLPVFSFVQSAAGVAAGLLVDFGLMMIFLIFLVSGHSIDKEKTGIALEIDEKVRGYILTKVATSLLTALSVWIVLESFHLDLALMLGLLTFFLAFIPTLGSLVATLLPLPIALIQFEGGWQVLGIIFIPAVIQILIGNILEPKLLGKGLDLHPITILLSLMFWGLIWGVGGAFLAVPVTAVLKIVLEKIALTKGFSEMLAGRSPFRQA